MKSFFDLLKININIAFLQLNFVRRGSKKKRSRNTFIVTIIIIVGAIAAYLSFYSWMLTGVMAGDGFDFRWLLLPFTLVIITFMTFMTSLYTVNSMLFESKDTDQLMAYPISVSTILYSRLLALVGENWIVGLVIAIPISVVYVIRTGPAWYFYPMMLLATLFAVLIPLAVILLIGVLTAAISGGRRFRNILRLIFTLGFVVALIFFIKYMIGFARLDSQTIDNTSLINALKGAWPPAGWITGAMVTGSFTDFLVGLAIGVVPFALLVWLTSLVYRRVLTSSATTAKYKSKPLRLTSGSVWQTLLAKETRRLTSSVMYMLNSGIGVVILTIYVIIYLVNRHAFQQIMTMAGNPMQIMLLAFCVMMSMTSTTPASISLEGKNLWIIKTIPVSAMQILGAKLSLNMIITVPLMLINSVLATVAAQGRFVDGIMLFIISSLFSLLTALVGLIANLHYNRFDFYNDQQVVKNSASVMITLFGMWILVAAAAGLYLLLKAHVPYDAYVIGCGVILAAGCYAAYRYLRRNSERLFLVLDASNNN